ncbi:MAG TPA: carboxypeptidase-like regulatory domain-containing protein [Terriglobales bacterium]|nr:carboxypeptidase-like regulatory domain-containing protein [Terriglobales bacterium]
MFRKLGFLAMLMALALPAWSESAKISAGTISGYVRDRSGVPQMGAAVEILGLAARRVFTNDHGFYSIAALVPGSYSIKVSAPSFLPTLRERVNVRSGGKLMVNVTLTNLFEAIQLVTVPTQADQDDWKWTLRAISNRPILRVLPDGSTAIVENGHDLKGTVKLLAGAPGDGFGGSSDMSAAFSVERSLLSTGTVRFNGNVGFDSTGSTNPAAVIRTTYTSHYNDVFEPSLSISALRLNSPDINTMPGASLQALSVRSSDRVVLGDMLEVNLGSELQSIQFLGHVHAFKPFGSADLHISPNTVVEYEFTSSVPDSRLEDRLPDSSSGQLNAAPADPGAAGPRMSMTDFVPAVERAQHQEVSISHRAGKTNLQLAVFDDRIIDPVLTGVGDLTAETGDVLPDLYSGTFSYQGSDFSTMGVRAVLQRKLLNDLTATLDYAYGGVLDLSQPGVQLQDVRDSIHTARRQAVAAKFSGKIPKTKTHWVASYRYSGGHSLTPVDLFNTSPGAADPYLNFFVRQPIPSKFVAGHMELLVDIRNLLAQGYVPVIGADGQTVYLVQSARSVRGGLAFNF